MAQTLEQTQQAIARLKAQSTASIRQVLENARRAANDGLAEACEGELRIRGSLQMSGADAKQAILAEERTAGKSLAEVIEIAFEDIPGNPEEVVILRWIAANPGTTFNETAKAYGRNDLALVIGHLVYNRFGYFRRFLAGQIQSDVLLARLTSPEGVRYTLRAETAAALAGLGTI